jgi:hypothetical protein
MNARPIRVVYGELQPNHTPSRPTATALLIDDHQVIGHLSVFTGSDPFAALGALDALVDRVIELWEMIDYEGPGRATVSLPDHHGSVRLAGLDDLDARYRALVFLAAFQARTAAAAGRDQKAGRSQTASTDLPSRCRSSGSIALEARTRTRSQKRICRCEGWDDRSRKRFPAEASRPTESR